MATQTSSKPWYRKKHGVVIAIVTFPIFLAWYIWVKLERSLLFKVGATSALAAVVAGISATVAIAAQSPPQAPQTAQNAQQASDVAADSDQPLDTTTPSGATSADSGSNTSASTPAQNSLPAPAQSSPSQPQTQQPVLTLAQQYPNTYPTKWSSITKDSTFDDWGMNNRESTSYTAWKVNEAFSNMPKWGYAPAPYPNGNASYWPGLATRDNISSGTTPKVHSVGIKNNLSVWVEAIDGSNVIVSYYNFNNDGNYGIQEMPASSFTTYIYFGG